MEITSNAIFVKKGKILFEKRRKDEDNYADLWALPGGHKRKKESSKKALIREMKEELGVKIKKTRFIGRFKDIDPTSKKLYSHHVFLCLDCEGKIKKTYEQKKLKWLDADKIKKLKQKGKLRKLDIKILKSAKLLR